MNKLNNDNRNVLALLQQLSEVPDKINMTASERSNFSKALHTATNAVLLSQVNNFQSEALRLAHDMLGSSVQTKDLAAVFSSKSNAQIVSAICENIMNYDNNAKKERWSTTRIAVYSCDEYGNPVAAYPSMRQAAAAVRCSPACICLAVHKKTRTSRGYYWRRVDEVASNS